MDALSSKIHTRSVTLLFVGASLVAATAFAAVLLAISGTDVEGLERALRLTARFSFVLFWCAYAGGALAAIDSRFRLMARHGRDFGLAFASAHSVHLLLVIWLYRIDPQSPLPIQMAVFFSIGMIWMYFLTLFSIRNLSWFLGPGLWRVLRLLGLEYIMLAFQMDFVPYSVHAHDVKTVINYVPFAVLGIAGTFLRLHKWSLSFSPGIRRSL